MSEFLGSSLLVDDLEELNLRMAQISPYILKKDYFEQSHSLQFSGQDGKLNFLIIFSLPNSEASNDCFSN